MSKDAVQCGETPCICANQCRPKARPGFKRAVTHTGVFAPSLLVLLRKDGTVADIMWDCRLSCGHSVRRRAVFDHRTDCGEAPLSMVFEPVGDLLKCHHCQYEALRTKAAP